MSCGRWKYERDPANVDWGRVVVVNAWRVDPGNRAKDDIGGHVEETSGKRRVSVLCGVVYCNVSAFRAPRHGGSCVSLRLSHVTVLFDDGCDLSKITVPIPGDTLGTRDTAVFPSKGHVAVLMVIRRKTQTLCY